MRTALFVALWLVAAAYILFWLLAILRTGGKLRPPRLLDLAIGFGTNFFDTLGIGSFATTSSLYKLGGMVRDEDIPGTLNVGDTLPTFAEALIFMALVEVDVTTLASMIASSARIPG